MSFSFGHSAQINTNSARVRWVVQKTSSLQITGKTNVGPFGCAVKSYYKTDTITYNEHSGYRKEMPLTGTLQVAIKDFNCHNNGLTNDLRKTLKSVNHPYLTIALLSLERAPILDDKTDTLNGWIDVSLAGVTKRVQIAYTLQKDKTVIRLNGAQKFCFAQFNLVPPQKLGGMIKVKNDFLVDFNLVLHQIS